jgi:hypothetical protein
MNGEPRTELIQPINRTGSLSVTTISRPPADVDSSPLGDLCEAAVSFTVPVALAGLTKDWR